MFLSCPFLSAVVILVAPGGWYDDAKDIFHSYRGIETLGYDFNATRGLQSWYKNQLYPTKDHPRITILDLDSDMKEYVKELQYQVNRRFKNIRCPKP